MSELNFLSDPVRLPEDIGEAINDRATFVRLEARLALNLARAFLDRAFDEVSTWVRGLATFERTRQHASGLAGTIDLAVRAERLDALRTVASSFVALRQQRKPAAALLGSKQNLAILRQLDNLDWSNPTELA